MASSPLYSTSTSIRTFNGLNQTGDGYNMNMQYAWEMENVNVTGGSFKPMREGYAIPQTLANPIGTLAYLHRRYNGTAGTVLMAVSDGKVYTKQLDGGDDWVQRRSGLTVNECDWVTYEVNTYATYSASRGYAVGERCTYNGTAYRCKTAISSSGEAWNSSHWEALPGTDPVDILLFTNASDGMFCLYSDTLDVIPIKVTPDPTNRPNENIKFGIIARYNERIWGSGITGDPDKLMYSVPFDPFNWQANTSIPEDGAGDILQPTWDGDRFVSLRQFGSYLLCLKRNSVWRIYGTNPGEFTMQQQYGGGTISENTLAIHNQYAYMLGEYGMMQYNGNGAYAFRQDALMRLFREQVTRSLDLGSYPEYSRDRHYFPGDRCQHNGIPYRCRQTTSWDDSASPKGEAWTAGHWIELDMNPLQHTCAGMWNDTYCLALPINGSDYCNAILQYDTAAKTISLRTEVSVDSFLQINERLFYTSADYPGVVLEMDDLKGKTKFVKWISGYQDLGLKSSIKSAFTVYLMVDAEVPVDLRLGIRTEKKLKRKLVTTKPGKLTRVHLNTHGRIFRLEIESFTSAPYTIAGGIKIDMELDPD